MIYEIVKHQKDAEDVLQEAFGQMWKKAAAYDPQRGTVFTWAVMSARKRAFDRLRARQRSYQLAEAAAAEFQLGAPNSARPGDDFFSDRDERERVRVALGHIPTAQRVAIDLAFFTVLTQSEIAEKLGAPLGTVRARIRRGLLALRDQLTTV